MSAANDDDLIRSTSAMNEWLAQVDDDLAEMKAPTVAQVLHTYRSGELCAVSGRTRTDPETAIALWGPLRQHSLALRGAEPAVTDLEAVLDEWIADELEFCSTRPDDDRALTIYAPAAMLNLPRVLIKRGFAPVSSTGIRHIADSDRMLESELPDWIRVRQVRDDDRPAVARQLRLIHNADVAAGCAEERPNAASLLTAYIDEIHSLPTGHAWLAEETSTGEVIGCASLGTVDSSGWATGLVRAKPAAYLGFMGVDPAFRRGGVGTTLLSRLHARAAELELAAVLVEHAVPNPLSTPFWHRRGYRPVATTWRRWQS